MRSRSALAWRCIGFLGLLILVYELSFAGRIMIFSWVEPKNSSFMRAYREQTNTVPSYLWVDYKDISSQVKRAVIASEDTKFLHHRGFDWTSLRYAAAQNVKEGKIVSGGSTITQQLAKNLFLSPSRSVWRKVQESMITIMLETILSKKRILEIYLNVIEWGRGIYGVEAAAKHYFNQNADNLSEFQAAQLATYIPAPRRFDLGGDTERSLKKLKIIRGRMANVNIPHD